MLGSIQVNFLVLELVMWFDELTTNGIREREQYPCPIILSSDSIESHDRVGPVEGRFHGILKQLVGANLWQDCWALVSPTLHR